MLVYPGTSTGSTYFALVCESLRDFVTLKSYDIYPAIYGIHFNLECHRNSNGVFLLQFIVSRLQSNRCNRCLHRYLFIMFIFTFSQSTGMCMHPKLLVPIYPLNKSTGSIPAMPRNALLNFRACIPQMKRCIKHVK